jgi:hypothetical protein
VWFLQRVVWIIPLFLDLVPPSLEPKFPDAKDDDGDNCYTSNDTTDDGTNVGATAAAANGSARGSRIGRLDTCCSSTGVAVAERLVADFVRLARGAARGNVGTLDASFEEGSGG